MNRVLLKFNYSARRLHRQGWSGFFGACVNVVSMKVLRT